MPGRGPCRPTRRIHDEDIPSVLPILLVFSVLIVAGLSPLTTGVVSAGATGVDDESRSRADDPPFVIRSDTEMRNVAHTESWPGSGSAADPYILSGYDINGSDLNNAIIIEGTSLHLVIRNNLLHNVTRVSDPQNAAAAIYLENARNVTIASNTFRDCHENTWGVYMRDACATIDGNTFSRCDGGVYLRFSEGDIVNNTLVAHHNGIYIDSSWSSNRIVGNDVICMDIGDGMTTEGVFVSGHGRYSIEQNTIEGWTNSVGTRRCIVSVQGNNITNCTNGLYLDAISDSVVANNSVSCSNFGIMDGGTTNVSIWDNALKGCNIEIDDMLGFRNWRGHSFGNNTIDGVPIVYMEDERDKELDGRYSQYLLLECWNITFRDLVMKRSFGGIFASFSWYVTMSNVIIDTTLENAFIMNYCGSHWNVTNSTLGNIDLHMWGYYRSWRRVWIDDALVCDNTLTNGTFETHYLRSSRVLNNTMVTDTMEGMHIMGTSDITIHGNNVTLTAPVHGSSAMVFDVLYRASITNNSLWNGGFYLWGPDSSWSDKYAFIDNTVNGRPVLFRTGETTEVVTGSGYGQIILGNCRWITLQDVEIVGGTIGVQMLHCNDVYINSSRFVGQAWAGVYTRDGWLTNISDSRFEGCFIGIETYLEDATYIIGNTILDSTSDGILIEDGEQVRIRGNIIVDSGDDGIDYDVSFVNNEITHNYIGNSSSEAIDVKGSSIIHHNTFVNNNIDPATGKMRDTQCIDMSYYSHFDDDISEGNYWSDYEERYPTATNDGTVWSIPYKMSGWTRADEDSYPLVRPWDPLPPIANAGRDFAVFENERFELNASRSWDNLGIVSYRWSLDDGGMGQPREFDGMVVPLVLRTPGDYRAWVRVRDAADNSASDYVDIKVRFNPPPVADAGGNVTVDQSVQLTLDGTTSTDDQGIGTYRWIIEHSAGTSHLQGHVAYFTWEEPGTYAVDLTVTDLLGKEGTVRIWVTVLDALDPVARVPGSQQARMGEEVVFNGSLSSDNVGVTNWTWTFHYIDSVVTLHGVTSRFTFDVPGEYRVTLEVADATGNTGMTTFIVEVSDNLAPVFQNPEWAPGITVEETELEIVLEFDQTLWVDDDPRFPEGCEFTWTFKGNNGTVEEQGAFVNITLPGPGRYDATFTAEDLSGNVGYFHTKLTVDWAPVGVMPPIPFAGEDRTIVLGETIDLLGTYTLGDLDVIRTEWSIPAEPPYEMEGDALTFTPDSVGVWELTYQVWDRIGNIGEDAVIITVLPGPPTIEVLVEWPNGPVSGTFTIHGTAVGDVEVHRVEYRIDGGEWDLANGTDEWSISIDTDELENGNHTLALRAWDGYSYKEAGPYPFQVNNLHVIDDNGGDGDDDDGVGILPWVLIGISIVVMVLVVLYLGLTSQAH